MIPSALLHGQLPLLPLHAAAPLIKGHTVLSDVIWSLRTCCLETLRTIQKTGVACLLEWSVLHP